MQNKGSAERSVATLNGRVVVSRRRCAAPGAAPSHPIDAWLDRAEDGVSLGLRELACRLALASRNFDKAAENRARSAQVRISGELLRQVVLAEGRAVLEAARSGKLPAGWRAADCPALDSSGKPTERWYDLGVAYSLSDKAKLSFNWEISDYDSKGVRGFGPFFFSSNRTRAQGGLISTQLTVKF